MPRNRFTPAQEAVIAAQYAEGKSSNTLALEHGCSSETILNVTTRHGITRRPPGRGWKQATPALMAEIRDRYAAGESQERIGDALGLSQSVISRFLRESGVKNGRGLADGARHPRWKGGRIVVGGYVHVWTAPDHPRAAMRNGTGYVPEHRLALAESLGRDLTPTETVHHVDGDPLNNRLDNLQLRQGRHGKGHVAACLACGSRDIGSVEL